MRRRRRGGHGGQDVRALVEEHLGQGRPTGWFEPLYARADGDAAAVPWGGLDAHPYLASWLDDPPVTTPGRRAVVVGAGLGGDALACAAAGYDVTAFDVAPSAVGWARQRLPEDVEVVEADLLALPDELVGSFDLVVEVRTVQSLPGVVRDAAMHAVASLAAPQGVVVVVTLLATSAEAASRWSGPPWAQAPSELAAYLAGGLRRLALEHPIRTPSTGRPDPQGEDALDVRVTFVRDAAGPGTLSGGVAVGDVLGIGDRTGG